MTRKSERIARVRRARLRALLHSTFAAAIAVVIGLSGAGATYAFLTSTMTAPGGTITAGTLTLQINDSSAAALGPFGVTPNSPLAKAFKVTNTGDAPATLEAVIAAATTPAITGYTLARITPVASAAACVPGLSGPQATLNGYSATLDGGSLDAGEDRWFCLEVGLASGTPVTVSGQGLNFNLTVHGTQSAS